jgi:Ca2+-binding RTX toxin-like protein
MEGGRRQRRLHRRQCRRFIIEAATYWIDEVRSSITYALAANLEKLTLTGTAAINGTGNASSNHIVGNDAANILSGGGGSDTLEGRGGNDTYIIATYGSTIIEQAGGGVDTMLSAVTWALDSEIENLTLTGTAAIDGYGNDSANVLTGNAAANLLNGGLGADTMIGGAGDDTYVVDDLGDVVTEAAGAGTDTVQSEFSYTLTADLENLTLLDSLAGNTNGTGNALANVIIGNSWDNVIDGGAGADTMEGGYGDDVFIVDNAGDTAADISGVDEVRSSVSFTLGIVVENLTLTGTGAIDGTGNGVDNWLVGNGAANRLDGGLGGDLMEGGAGNDTYVVDDIRDQVSEAAGNGVDTVEVAFSYTLGDNLEKLVLLGTDLIDGFGNALANTLVGNDAVNLLDGWIGADTMQGGLGDDIYIVDNVLDVALEAAGAGADQIRSTVSFTLGANVENLQLFGSSDLAGTGMGWPTGSLETAARTCSTARAAPTRWKAMSATTPMSSTMSATLWKRRWEQAPTRFGAPSP